MTPDKYRETLNALGLTQAGAATLFDASERTGRNWARYGPPVAVAVLLRMARAQTFTLDMLSKLIKRER